MPDVTSFGSVNVDLVARLDETTMKRLAGRYEWFPTPDETVAVTDIPGEIDRLPDATHLGGKGANQAVAAARAGAPTALCGRVGPDQERYRVRSSLASWGVDVSAVEEAEVETGKAYVFVEEDGETRIAILAGANGTVDPAYVDRHRAALSDADCLLLQNEIPMTAMETLVGSLEHMDDRPTMIFDPAPPLDAATLLGYAAVDIVTPNAYEYERLADELEAFSGTVIRKRGPRPVIVEPADDPPFQVEPPAVSPVDTTGAGDVFCGYLAARLAAGDPLMAAVELAATAASLATTEEGAQNAIPPLSVVRDFRS